MDWSREKCLQLIGNYENHPCLWNPLHGLYYNKVKKHSAWVNISNAMCCSTKEVKKKMESILSSFRREKAKGKETVGTGKGRREIYSSKWFAFSRLTFLLDRDVEPRLTISLEDNRVGGNPEETGERDEDPIEKESQEVIRTVEESIQQSPKEKRTTVTVKRTRPSVYNKVHLVKNRKSLLDSQIDEALDRRRNDRLEGISDDCSDYGKHIGNKLRNYSERLRSVVQYHMNNILFQADMGYLDANMEPTTMIYRLPFQQPSAASSEPSLNTNNTTSIPATSPETDCVVVSYASICEPNI